MMMSMLAKCVMASCNHERLQSCTVTLQSAIGNNQLLFVTDQLQLDMLCKKMNQGLTCIEEYISPCFTPKQKDTYMKLSSDAYDVINELCSPGKMQDDYLRYTSECVSEGYHEYKLCGNGFESLIEDGSAQDTPEQVELYKVDTCCTYSNYIHCIIMKVEQMCGNQVRQFVQDLIYRSSNAFTQSHCQNLTFSSDWCSAGCRPFFGPLDLVLIIITTTLTSVTVFNPSNY